MLTSERIVVLDGHDGCGKSTLNEFLARHIGATVVGPFADTLGDHIAWLWQHQRFTEAGALARASVERVLASGRTVGAMGFAPPHRQLHDGPRHRCRTARWAGRIHR
jgi:energy-coupling factor transporter ATP-binding protein EcfA2